MPGERFSLMSKIQNLGKEKDDLMLARDELLLQVKSLTGELTLLRQVVMDQEARVQAEKLESDRLAEINKVFQVEVEKLRKYKTLTEPAYCELVSAVDRLNVKVRETEAKLRVCQEALLAAEARVDPEKNDWKMIAQMIEDLLRPLAKSKPGVLLTILKTVILRFNPLAKVDKIKF